MQFSRHGVQWNVRRLSFTRASVKSSRSNCGKFRINLHELDDFIDEVQVEVVKSSALGKACQPSKGRETDLGHVVRVDNDDDTVACCAMYKVLTGLAPGHQRACTLGGHSHCIAAGYRSVFYEHSHCSLQGVAAKKTSSAIVSFCSQDALLQMVMSGGTAETLSPCQAGRVGQAHCQRSGRDLVDVTCRGSMSRSRTSQQITDIPRANLTDLEIALCYDHN